MMPPHLKTILLPLVVLTLGSCDADKPSAKLDCRTLGQRIGEQSLHGVIYGPVGAKLLVKDCPGGKLSFAFIGDVPADFKRLEQLAKEREDVLGFDALGDGFIVTEGHGEYVLLLIELTDVREDPSVARAASTARN